MIKWNVINDCPGHMIGYRAIVDNCGYTVVAPSPMGADNARLIAAAPDMVHALRLLLREHDALQMAENRTEDRWPAATLARKILIRLGPLGDE